MTKNPYVDALRLVMLVGAARYDATPEQRERLRAELKPHLDRYRATGDERGIRRVVREVMGADWRPSKTWVGWT